MEGKSQANLSDVEAVKVDTPPTGMKIEGITTFTSRRDTSFRFVFSVTDDKMNVWLEDRKSKLRWETGYLGMADFVTNDNIIGKATLQDYAHLFKRALEETLDGTAAEKQRQLVDEDHGQLQLTIVAELVVLDVAWALSYTFELVPIATAQVDLVESRLFDVEEKMGRLDALEQNLATVVAKVDEKLARIFELESKMEEKLRALTPSLTEFESVATQHGAYVEWKPVTSDVFAVENGRTIRVHCTGTYLVILQAEYPPQSYGTVSMNLNGKEVIQTSFPVHTLNRNSFGCASWGLHLSKGDTLSLIAYNTVSSTTGSKMVIIKLASAQPDALPVNEAEATHNDINTCMVEDY
ncbi:hypothetical protein DVH05_015785 [Phytophthora capsici]|nr:hypothetical protein DVH05_015785 [Phytophthora capsici]